MAEDNGRNTVPGMVADMGRTLVGALPPAFLMLVLLNAAFLTMVVWFLNHQQDQRNTLVSKLVEQCMLIALHADAPK